MFGKKCLLAGCVMASMSVQATVLEIALVIDGSGSIKSSDYQLQLDGYKNTFSTGTFYDDYIAGSIYDSVYFSAYQFSSSVLLEVDWTLIDSNSSATAFGDLFNTTEMAQLNGWTATGDAIYDASASLLGNAIGGGDGDSMIIDISTDGQPTKGSDSLVAAEYARSNEITINAIGVGSGINAMFLEDLVGLGGGSEYAGFYLEAPDFNAFGDAIESKIAMEVTGGDPKTEISEPASLAMFGFGALAMGALRRRKVAVAS
ncbi:DUF1194 domain-containing protein [Vibrio alfacsensis]|uniref:DUF1194 domain-containing protein n=1 Tax=Vibrio alfacsensis TaxID=1074311 RepID=UPI004069134E